MKKTVGSKNLPSHPECSFVILRCTQDDNPWRRVSAEARGQAGTLVGLVIMSTILGMALGGWMSGAIYDLTSSYWQAFANGFLWNVLNIWIMYFLLRRRRTRLAFAAPRPAMGVP